MNASNPGSMTFTDIRLTDLVLLADDQLDALAFGVVGLSSNGTVEIYNKTESKLAGLPRETVVGSHFFSSIAQCMNNFMVAQRLDDESEIDSTIDYVLTLRMRPTPVRLRLLKDPEFPRRYILIQR